MKLAAFVVLLAPLAALAQQQDPIQRALIERDRQSAEFARPELRDLHLRLDLRNLPARPDQRMVEERERNAQPALAEQPIKSPEYGPLPLPGGPAHVVDPIPVEGRGS